MQHDHKTPTSVTLLVRLKDPNDPEAWNLFLERYTPRIFDWCRRHGLHGDEIEDVAQTVLLRMVDVMRTFNYDQARRSFRGYLRTTTRNAVIDFVRSRKRAGQGQGGPDRQQALEAIQAPDTVAELEDAMDAEVDRDLLQEAAARVKRRVAARTWKAFRLTALEGIPAAEVAKRLNMPVGMVYVAKSRVVRMLKSELENLNRSGPTPDDQP